MFSEIEKHRSHLQSWQGPVPVVVDAYFVNGLGVVRSLHQIGVRSLALSRTQYGLGTSSRFALGLVCPDYTNAPGTFVNFLVELGQTLPQPGILFVTEDTCLRVLNAARSDLEPYYRFPFPGGDVIPRIQDKWEQYQAALRCGVPVPLTLKLENEDSLAQWPDDLFPALIKGQCGKDFCYDTGRQVIQVRDRQEALRIYWQLRRFDLLLQEIIPGGDGTLDNLGTYISCRTGQILGAFSFRKLTTVPPVFGVARVAESDHLPEIIRYATDLLAEFGFYGAAHVEFRRDPRDGQDKLIEINPRFWLSNIHAAACGVNIAALLYRELTGQPVEPVLSHLAGHRYLLAGFELSHLFDPPGVFMNLSVLARSLCAPHIDPLLDFRDPMPGLMYLRHHLK